MIDIDFYKFPSTPYIVTPTSSVSRNDKILIEAEKNRFLSSEITVEEKIDGTNLGISFDRNGVLHLQHRGSYIEAPYLGQWEILPLWLDYWRDSLFDVLLDRYIIFGEWCYLTHSIFYDSLPDWFLAFDIFDKQLGCFLSTNRRNNIITEIGVKKVPVIAKGIFSLPELYSFINKSHYGSYLMEGLYLRKDNGGKLLQRAKYVRSSFSQSIDSHWTKQKSKKNQLSFE